MNLCFMPRHISPYAIQARSTRRRQHLITPTCRAAGTAAGAPPQPRSRPQQVDGGAVNARVQELYGLVQEAAQLAIATGRWGRPGFQFGHGVFETSAQPRLFYVVIGHRALR
jgi:hypothetical protein